MPRTKTIARANAQDQALASQIGQRLRDARKRAGLTQQQLAGERYTKAYISALETGIARPSMVALTYLSERLGLPASHFLDERHPAWNRLEVDLRLASGDWQGAADGYRELLDTSLDEQARAEVLRGLAEALVRQDGGRDAVAAAAESARLFGTLGRAGDAALARYWLAYALYLTDAGADANSLLQALLQQVRMGLKVDPDFEMRLLTALAAIEARDGDHHRALGYLEEAKGFADDLDDARRAHYLFNLAIGYREAGDVEAAIRVGLQGLALFRAAGIAGESARLENDLAMAFLAIGNVERASALAHEAHAAFEQTGDERNLAAVLETEAQIALADGRPEDAQRLARSAVAKAHATGYRRAELAAMLTEARALRQADDHATAEQRYADAAAIAREADSPVRIREVLREWADLRAAAGDHRGAYELSREALAVN
jgi:transcriptional regulator with XRE-family HTH domain